MPRAAKKAAAVRMPAESQAPPAPGRLSRLLQEHLAKAHVGAVSAGSGVTVRLQGVVSTRSALLDAAIGRGGVPFGRMTTVTGNESGGKTTLCLHLAAEVQATGGVVLYIDNEHKLDTGYAANLGVNLDELIISQPQSGEEAFAIAESMLERVRAEPGHQDVPVLIILDSINATTPKSVMEGGYDDHHVGVTARLFSQALPKITKKLSGLRVAFVMVSQYREKITFHGAFREKLSGGGNAVKFYTSLAIELARTSDFVKEGERAIGSIVEATCIKNQIAKPFGRCKLNLIWGQGFDYHHSLLTRGAELGLLNIGAGGWHEMTHPETGEVFKWQGARAFHKNVLSQPVGAELVKHLELKTRERFAL
jgi:recombination protein RecA